MLRVFFRASAFAIALLIVASAANAQGNRPIAKGAEKKEAEKKEATGEGSELFRDLLHLHDIKPVKEQELRAPFQYRDAIVIIIGNPYLQRSGGANPLSIANNAARSGGAVLILSSDRLVSDRFAFNVFGESELIQGRSVECNQATSIFREHLRDCPFVVPIDKQGRAANESQAELWKLFQGMERLLNHSPAL